MNTRVRIGIAAWTMAFALAAVVLPAAAQPIRTSPRTPASKPEGKPPASSKDLGDVPHTKVTVEFAVVGDKHLMMSIYTPKDLEGKLPLVVWIYGGAWRNLWTNDPRSMPGGNGIGVLVKNGYAVASISHRLARSYGGSKAWVFPAQIHDCKGAIRFLRANAEKYSLNVDRIGVWGGSSGGHLAALLGASGGVKSLEGSVGGNLNFSSRVHCVVDCSGPTDLSRLEKTCAHLYGPGQSPPATLVGGPTLQHKDLVKMANPVTYVTKDSPPFLIAHGDKDTLVPMEQSQLLVDALKGAGVKVTFEVVKGVGHGGATPAQDARLNHLVLEFFDKHLKTTAIEEKLPPIPPRTAAGKEGLPAEPPPKPPRSPEERAKSRLALARVYLEGGMAARATTVLQTIIMEFPQTPAAKDAKAELQRLTDRNPKSGTTRPDDS